MPTPTDYLKKGALRTIEPAISLLARHNVSPNAITTVGTLLTIAAGVVYGTGHIMTAGWIMAATAFFDVVDGEVARRTGRSTVFGAFLDSTLDRVEEGAVLTAVAWYFADTGHAIPAAACVATVLGSLMVSYTRARAEALGVECKVGIATRPVRVVLLSIGLVFAKGAQVFDVELLAPAIYAIGALTAVTVVQRVWHVRRALAALDVSEV